MEQESEAQASPDTMARTFPTPEEASHDVSHLPTYAASTQ